MHVSLTISGDWIDRTSIWSNKFTSLGRIIGAVPPLSSTNKVHQLPQSQVLLSLQKSLHFGSTYASDVSKTKISIVHELIMKFLSHVLFYLVFFLITFILICSWWWDNILKCNLWFGLVGQFGLLKICSDIFIFSFSLFKKYDCIKIWPYKTPLLSLLLQ